MGNLQLGNYVVLEKLPDENFPLFWPGTGYLISNWKGQLRGEIPPEVKYVNWPGSYPNYPEWTALVGKKGVIIASLEGEEDCPRYLVKLVHKIKGQDLIVVHYSSLKIIPNDPDDNY